MKVKNYTIQRELSRGPITTVFLATQDALERIVLLKILNVQWKGEKDLVERFQREAKICARLKHPNIVNIFDFGTSENSFYLAMEYIDGWNLAEFIKKNHSLPFKVIQSIFFEILKGLQYAHAQGVIHRDIKPANIMIGKDGTVKISDFGLATIADFPAVTEMGSTVGTPAYMSPEQAKGKKLDSISDLFSLGTTIYETVSGENPFMGENFAESIQLILTKKQIPLSKKREETPPWLSDLIQRLLEKNPSKRISSATEIIQNLKLYLAHANQITLVKFIQEPSDIRSDLIEEDGTSRKFSKKTKPLFIFLSMIAVSIITVFFFLQRNGTVNPNLSDKNISQKINISDSIQIIAESNLDTSKYAKPKFTNNTPEEKAIPPSNPDPDIEDNLEDKESEFTQKEIIPEVKSGKIFISTYPWAKIFIDGKYQETTPLKESIKLKAGTYTLRLENPHFVTIEQNIKVQPETSDTLNFNLVPSIGFLDLQVIPWAEIYIDGEYKETTPLKDPISLPAGKHQLKLVNPNLSTWSDSINIEPGRTFTKQVSLLN